MAGLIPPVAMLYRGILDQLTVKDGEISCQVSLLNGQKMTNVEYIQEYGFASLPPIGSRVIVGLVFDGEDNATILKVEHPDFRPALAPGEVAIYDKTGKVVKLDDGGNIEVNTKINSDKDIETSADAIAAGISLNSHTHNENDAAPGPTDGPN